MKLFKVDENIPSALSSECCTPAQGFSFSGGEGSRRGLPVRASGHGDASFFSVENPEPLSFDPPADVAARQRGVLPSARRRLPGAPPPPVRSAVPRRPSAGAAVEGEEAHRKGGPLRDPWPEEVQGRRREAPEVHQVARPEAAEDGHDRGAQRARAARGGRPGGQDLQGDSGGELVQAGRVPVQGPDRRPGEEQEDGAGDGGVGLHEGGGPLPRRADLRGGHQGVPPARLAGGRHERLRGHEELAGAAGGAALQDPPQGPAAPPSPEEQGEAGLRGALPRPPRLRPPRRDLRPPVKEK